MKNFLRTIQNIQNDCFGGFKGTNESNLAGRITKEPNLEGRVAGATISNPKGEISFEEYVKITGNTNGYFKEWKRFKEDSNKIILEKNFFLNSLNLIGNSFIFRPINNDGYTYIRVFQEFISSIPKNNYKHRYVFALVLLLFLTLALVINLFFLMLFFLIIAMYNADKRIKLEKEQKFKKWENKIAKNPQFLLGASPCSFRSGTEDRRILTTFNIYFKHSPFEAQYIKMLNSLAVAAVQMNGKIVWLWRYHKSSEIADAFKFACGISKTKDYHDAHIRINLDIMRSNLIPAIETEDSFIFFLEHYTEEMEKDHEVFENTNLLSMFLSYTNLRIGLFKTFYN